MNEAGKVPPVPPDCEELTELPAHLENPEVSARPVLLDSLECLEPKETWEMSDRREALDFRDPEVNLASPVKQASPVKWAHPVAMASTERREVRDRPDRPDPRDSPDQEGLRD